MLRGTKPSLEELSLTIEAIHGAALDNTLWPEVLGSVGRFFDASMATLWAQDSNGAYHDIGSTERYGEITHAYVEHYGRLDMIHPVVSRASAGSIFTDTMVLTRRELERTEFYVYFADRNGIQCCLDASRHG